MDARGLSLLNGLPDERFVAQLYLCCGSHEWTHRMLALRPFASLQHLQACADYTWWSCPESEWRASFLCHPRIGGDLSTLRQKYAAATPSAQSSPVEGRNTAWEGEEQGGARAASEATLQALSAGNAHYEASFDHVFLICATGKSADEMLFALRARLHNPKEAELLIATGEQAKITALRLVKLLAALEEERVAPCSSRL